MDNRLNYLMRCPTFNILYQIMNLVSFTLIHQPNYLRIFIPNIVHPYSKYNLHNKRMYLRRYVKNFIVYRIHHITHLGLYPLQVRYLIDSPNKELHYI